MKKMIFVLMLILSMWVTIPPVAQNYHHSNIVQMTDCNNQVAVKFTIPLVSQLVAMGLNLTADTIYDTGSMLSYINKLDVYYVTKRNEPSVRYDGEIFEYQGHNCIE